MNNTNNCCQILFHYQMALNVFRVSDSTSCHRFISLQQAALSPAGRYKLSSSRRRRCAAEGTSRFKGISSPTSCGESRTTESRKTLKDMQIGDVLQQWEEPRELARPQPLSGRSQAVVLS